MQTPEKNGNIPYLIFMLVMSVFVLGILIFDTLWKPNEEVRQILRWTDYGLCVLFFIDYVYNIAVSKKRLHYIFTWGLIDIASCIPVFGWGRIARMFRVIKLLKGIKTVKEFIETFCRKKRDSALFTAFTFWVCGMLFGSIAILQCEIAADGSSITNAADAVWYTYNTIIKGGCDGYSPVTTEGRIVAVVLSFLNAAIGGIIIAYIASLIMTENKENSQD
jgi:voltage-gated potassium channel